MAVLERLKIAVNQQPQETLDIVRRELREEHGVFGVDFLKQEDSGSVDPDLTISSDESGGPSRFSFIDRDGAPQSIEVDGVSEESLRSALSFFALAQLAIGVESQSSRPDTSLLEPHLGYRPAIEQDPSGWVASNPFISELSRRHPSYGNLLRFLCNERGLFLKVGNYANQRAYWNSTTNGGLPVYKKADAIHEGTFMLHDLFHLVPIDPLIGSADSGEVGRTTYLAHRLMSEASTLVLADMVGVADAPSLDRDYDTSKRRIYPIYESIVNNTGKKPVVEKLIAANVYFCFTGETTGFEVLGASEDVLQEYRRKYEQVFRDDYMWNLANYDFMANERATSSAIREYYEWIEESTEIPVLGNTYPFHHPSSRGADLPMMLSHFRAQYVTALNYPHSIDDLQRIRLAATKYLAGQRIVFARKADEVSPGKDLGHYDRIFAAMVGSDTEKEIVHAVERACSVVDRRVETLQDNGLLLPHEAALYRFSAPLYPVRFVNYERQRPGVDQGLSQELKSFIDMNQRDFRRLLDIVST